MSRKRPRLVSNRLLTPSPKHTDDSDELHERVVENASLEKEMLTNLVLLNCVSKLNRKRLKDRIAVELVCRRCANALHSVYNSQRKALVIGRFDASAHNYQQIFTDPLRREYRLKRRRHEIRLFEEDPQNRLRIILARFKRFRCITFHADDVKLGTRRFLEIVRTSRMRPIEVARLEYRLDLTTDLDFRLIAKFAPILKALVLDCLMPRSEYMAKKLWIAVAQCRNLQQLYFLPKNNTGYQDRFGNIVVTRADLFSIVYLQECLKVLNIRHFHCTAAGKIFNSGLVHAFASNSNLKRLFINGASNKFFTTPSARPVLSKLRTLVIDYFAERKRPQEEVMKLTTILAALPPAGYLTVFHLVDWHPNPWWNREEQRTSDEEYTLSALQFWLQLSNQTARRIKLCLRFYRNSIASVDHALRTLCSSDSVFSNLVLERSSGRTILRYQQARIDLSVTDARENSVFSKPISVW